MEAEQRLNTVPHSLRSDSQDAQRMRQCVSVSSAVVAATDSKDTGRRSAVQVVQRVPDPVTDKVMDNLVVRR